MGIGQVSLGENTRDAQGHPGYPGDPGLSSMLLSIHPDHPEPRKIRRAVDALSAGGVIAYPTDTVYGLGCDLTNKHAIERLYAIKGMDRSHPLAFVCPDLGNIARYALVDNQVYRVLKRFRTRSSCPPRARCPSSCR
jgi:hypothetical protein